MSASAAIDPEYVADLERRLAVAEAANTILEETNARLERLLAQARHETFGPKSEKGDPDQRNLFTEDLEVAEGQLAAAADAADKALGKKPRKKAPAKRNKGNLPAHLERIEEVIEIGDRHTVTVTFEHDLGLHVLRPAPPSART